MEQPDTHFKVNTVRISNWDELEKRLREKTISEGSWIFRGQECSCWGLRTRLERTVLNQNQAPDVEEKLKIEFERRYHHFERIVPETDEYLEWFALMQHYGAPTRLLDWTYSPYVAAFFALEKSDLKQGCAVWAINSTWLDNRFKELISKNLKLSQYKDSVFRKKEEFKGVFMQPHISLVNAINSYKLNVRQAAQQGVFLCPGNVSVPFEHNLAALVSSHDDQDENVIKFVIEKNLVKVRTCGLNHLHSMNISNASLFPGLEGFGRSLETRASFDQNFHAISYLGKDQNK